MVPEREIKVCPSCKETRWSRKLPDGEWEYHPACYMPYVGYTRADCPSLTVWDELAPTEASS